MKETKVKIRCIALQDKNGTDTKRYFHPSSELPNKFYKTNFSNIAEVLSVKDDSLLCGVVVSEVFVYEENPCVVVQLFVQSKYSVFETFRVDQLG